MSKHTPGPWIAELYEYACYFDGVTRDGWDVKGPNKVPDYEHPLYKEDDARLIAAAPDLLEALQTIVKSLADQDDEGLIEHAEPMIAARTAIAKATGETK